MGVEGGTIDVVRDEEARAALRDHTLPRLQRRLKLSPTRTRGAAACHHISLLPFLASLMHGDMLVAPCRVRAEALAQDGDADAGAHERLLQLMHRQASKPRASFRQPGPHG